MNYSKINLNDLAVLAKEDELALEYLLKKYRGLIFKKIRPYYLVGAEFDDLAQEAYWGFVKAVYDYDTSYGKSFINFAMLCISRQITTALTTANRQKMRPLNKSIRFEAYVNNRTRNISNNGDTAFTWGEVITTNIDTEEEVINIFTNQSFNSDIIEIMSDLELNVCDLMAQGYKLSEIALILDRIPKSIDNAMQRIRHKMIKYLEHKARGEKYVLKETGARCKRSSRPHSNAKSTSEYNELRRFH